MPAFYALLEVPREGDGTDLAAVSGHWRRFHPATGFARRYLSQVFPHVPRAVVLDERGQPRDQWYTALYDSSRLGAIDVERDGVRYAEWMAEHGARELAMHEW